ncbi:MAG: NfeD family protein [Rhodobacteraceae bacterium]|nr:NfeD family protein [Paracoccaceae bacterium]
MEFLNFLEGLSPWWWVATAFVLGAIEMATGTFVLIWVALASLVMAGLTAFAPGMSGELQTTVFAVLSVALTFVGRFLLNKYGDGGGAGNSKLNTRAAHFVGRTAKVVEHANGEGAIEVEGMRWRARWAAGQSSAVGGSVRITGADGMVLEVEAD